MELQLLLLFVLHLFVITPLFSNAQVQVSGAHEQHDTSDSRSTQKETLGASSSLRKAEIVLPSPSLSSPVSSSLPLKSTSSASIVSSSTSSPPPHPPLRDEGGSLVVSSVSSTSTPIPSTTTTIPPTVIERLANYLTEVLPPEYDLDGFLAIIEGGGGIESLVEEFAEYLTETKGDVQKDRLREEKPVMYRVYKELKVIGNYLGIEEGEVDHTLILDLAHDANFQSPAVRVIADHFEEKSRTVGEKTGEAGEHVGGDGEGGGAERGEEGLGERQTGGERKEVEGQETKRETGGEVENPGVQLFSGNMASNGERGENKALRNTERLAEKVMQIKK